jgi:hypothetical protein
MDLVVLVVQQELQVKVVLELNIRYLQMQIHLEVVEEVGVEVQKVVILQLEIQPMRHLEVEMGEMEVVMEGQGELVLHHHLHLIESIQIKQEDLLEVQAVPGLRGVMEIFL